MYLDSLEFLEEERDAWAPFEALAGLTDEELAVAVPEAHGWTGRQLMAHLVAWQESALAVATELAVNEVCLQGFRAGPHAAVQFHPEATQPIVASWLANANPPPGQEATDPLFKGAEGAWQQASANAGSFFQTVSSYARSPMACILRSPTKWGFSP